jgi:hypothetical protein
LFLPRLHLLVTLSIMASATAAGSSAGLTQKYNGKMYTPSALCDHLAQHIQQEKQKYEKAQQQSQSNAEVARSSWLDVDPVIDWPGGLAALRCKLCNHLITGLSNIPARFKEHYNNGGPVCSAPLRWARDLARRATSHGARSRVRAG